MEELKIRIEASRKALASLKESLNLLEDPHLDCLHAILRDSTIKRFEYSMDTFWKCFRECIEKIYKVDISIITPKATFRSALNVKIITEEQFNSLLKMVDDRNLTSHGYNEILAEEISNKIKVYYQTMSTIMMKFKID
jgi:nucleotidyltransferase substrate binding protein (TIGR01987 family)